MVSDHPPPEHRLLAHAHQDFERCKMLMVRFKHHFGMPLHGKQTIALESFNQTIWTPSVDG
jgi:hypothetical protein